MSVRRSLILVSIIYKAVKHLVLLGESPKPLIDYITIMINTFSACTVICQSVWYKNILSGCPTFSIIMIGNTLSVKSLD